LLLSYQPKVVSTYSYGYENRLAEGLTTGQVLAFRSFAVVAGVTNIVDAGVNIATLGSLAAAKVVGKEALGKIGAGIIGSAAEGAIVRLTLEGTAPSAAVSVLRPVVADVTVVGVRGGAGAAEAAGNATGVLGRSGEPLVNAAIQPLRNQATTISGRQFTGHALDQMQNRGFMPSVVENTISQGTSFPTRAGTTGFYDAVNNVRVITDSASGRVVTVIPGAP